MKSIDLILRFFVILLMPFIIVSCKGRVIDHCSGGYVDYSLSTDQRYQTANISWQAQMLESTSCGHNNAQPGDSLRLQPAPPPLTTVDLIKLKLVPGVWRFNTTLDGDGCTWTRVCDLDVRQGETEWLHVFRQGCAADWSLKNDYDATVPRTMTDFSHYTTGYSPCSWSERWAGDASNWVVRSGSGVGGKELQGDQTADGRRLLSWDEIPVAADVEILTKVMVHTVDPTVMGGRVYARAAGSLGAETGYFSFFAEGTTIGIYKYDDGDAELVASIPYAYNLGEWYWVRFRVVGNSLKLKVWPDGNTEPPGWGSPNGIEDTNSDLTEPGWVGVGTNYQSDGPYYDWFSVGLNGVSAQSP